MSLATLKSKVNQLIDNVRFYKVQNAELTANNEALQTENETLESRVDELEANALPDWDDDSPIIASGKAYYSVKNLEWELTEKGTFRWKFIEGVTGNNRAVIFSSNSINMLSASYKKIAPKIKQVYFPDGVINAEVVYATNCERIRFPDTITERHVISGLTSLKELDLSGEFYTTIPDYCCANMSSLEKVQLCPKTTILSRSSFEKCYSLKEINLENITDFKQMCLESDLSLTGAMVFNAGLTQIETSAFRTTNLTSVTFQNPTTGTYPTIHSTAFQYCDGIEEVIVPEGWATSLYFPHSTFTQEVLHTIIENLADLTGLTAMEFKVGNANIAKIDEEHIAMLNTKNWNYS